MKKYLKSIERRLNLPKDVRARVMSDFASSVEVRREAGQSDEEIRAELGQPKKVAAELNEQMKEYAYRKSPWRFVCLAVAILSGSWLAFYQILQGIGLLLNTLSVQVTGQGTAASIGVIGGADGPTAIFVATSSGPDGDVLLVVAILAVSILGFLRLRRCKQR